MYRYMVGAAILLGGALLGGATALASTTNISFNPSYAGQPFSFYCDPYKYSFEDGKHYVMATSTPAADCYFTIPSNITGSKNIAIYKGTPGNAAFVAGDKVIGGSPTLVQEHGAGFVTPAQDQEYFAVVYGYNSSDEDTAFDQALRTASSTGITAPSGGYSIIKWRWGAQPPSEFEPVIIIPGILGSWQNTSGTWVLDPIAHTYDNLVNTLLANGYVDGKTLFEFPYDWEQSNVTTAHLLAQKIQSIKQICSCSRVNLVGHSMGGLVAEQYIDSSDYANDVDQVIFLATPLLGAPKDYITWESGIINPDPETDTLSQIEDILLNRVYTREAYDNGYSSIFDYIHGKPVTSVQELLPADTDYLYDDNTFEERTYPTDYPRNTFIEGLVNNLNKLMNAVHITTVLADDSKGETMSGFLIQDSSRPPLWPDGEVTTTFYDLGDGTVPRSSIEGVFNPVSKEFTGDSHLSVASTSAPYIFNQLTNQKTKVLVGKKYDATNIDYLILAEKIAPSPGDFYILAKTVADILKAQTTSVIENNPVQSALLIMLYSPIDIEVTSPDGKRVGTDVNNGTTFNEIPGVVYSGPIGEHEYVLIPNPLPGTYKVQTVGTGNGIYTVAAGYASSATSSIREVTGTTTVGQILSNTLIVSATSTTVTIATDTPAPPPPSSNLTPDTCLTDLATAYKNKWIAKKSVYDNLVLDCKGLKDLLKTRGTLTKVAPAKRTKANSLLLGITTAAIKIVLADMDLLAKDKGNTKEGVDLIHKYTTWFRNQLAQ